MFEVIYNLTPDFCINQLIRKAVFLAFNGLNIYI